MTKLANLATRFAGAAVIALGTTSCVTSSDRYATPQPQGTPQQTDQPQYDPVIPLRIQSLANDLAGAEKEIATASRQHIAQNDHLAQKDRLYKILGGVERMELDTKIAIRLYGQIGKPVPQKMVEIHDDCLSKEDFIRAKIKSETLLAEPGKPAAQTQLNNPNKLFIN